MIRKFVGSALVVLLLIPTTSVSAISGYGWDNVDPNGSICTGSSNPSSATLRTYSGFSSGTVQLRYKSGSACGTAWSRFQTSLVCVPADYGCAYGGIERQKRNTPTSAWYAHANLGTIKGTNYQYDWGWSPMLFDNSGNNTLRARASANCEGPTYVTGWY